jgi:hypothetical protein
MRARLGAMAIVLVASAACSTGTGDAKHGGGGRADDDRKREQPSAPEQAPAGASDEGGVASSVVDAGAGTTWTALYRDFFGPTAPASCAGSGACHGSSEASGADGSNGYVCASRDGCRASMLSVETGLVQASDADAPEKSTLVDVLRRRSANGGTVGSMPKSSTYVFSDESIARVEAWIRNGAPDD